MALDPEFKQRWLEALRSGRYTPAGGLLRTDKGYCCLGVAADTIDPAAWENVSANGWRWRGAWDYMPEDMAAAVGLTLMDQSTLARTNDCAVHNGAKDFAAIIALIEEM